MHEAVRRLRSGVALLLLVPPASAPAFAEPAGDARPTSSREVLDRAFEQRYEVDLTSIIDLVVRDTLGQERRRRFRAMSKVIDDRVHSIGRLVEPDYLRGMTILTIEAKDRSHDAFLYLPSLGRVRRVSTAQRGDSFFGTDVTYEDLERRRAADYTLEPLEATIFAGEPAWRIDARPLRRFDYDRVCFTIARADAAMLQVQYYKRGADEPYRIVVAPRAGMVAEHGHIVPTRMSVTNLSRGTTTEVSITSLHIDPEIEDHAFSLQALESQRPLALED